MISVHNGMSLFVPLNVDDMAWRLSNGFGFDFFLGIILLLELEIFIIIPKYSCF